MTYRDEFPAFDINSMPTLPAGFEDVSWGNETCPHFLCEALKLHLFVDFAHAEDREFPETKRFSVHPFDTDGAPDAAVTVIETDDWTEARAAILGEAFTSVLRTWLTPQMFEEMQWRNTRPNYQGEACASHDVCDANMAMAAAFRTLFGREPVIGEGEPNAEPDMALWNAAWTLAKARHLTAPPPAADFYTGREWAPGEAELVVEDLIAQYSAGEVKTWLAKACEVQAEGAADEGDAVAEVTAWKQLATSLRAIETTV